MIGKTENLSELQKTIKYNFKNKDFLEIAVTHSSFANQKKDIKYNERLEFLGDSVLQLSISEYLFLNYSDKDEGELSRTRAIIVCENSLFNIASKWDLGKYIRMSKGEELTGGRTRVSILADCVEAIFAAVYLDSDFDYAREFVLKWLKDTVLAAINNQIVFDYKTKLQEYMQQGGDSDILYNIVNFEGPPHRRKFFVEVLINEKVMGRGSGFSKKEAEQNAAMAALRILTPVSTK